ncbi:hypothetical protein BDA99DRAFT_494416 [Phascolomyces articulosus]|uniref:Uncharacterized protein n=1 Tax=Phascolomyces articulosus TaxID=60185 RepID=A0AAD5KPB4_9FUNG|nr:hypothetical protein BDA99DRAFT_494416 [Phascolomyces articulosus]
MGMSSCCTSTWSLYVRQKCFQAKQALIEDWNYLATCNKIQEKLSYYCIGRMLLLRPRRGQWKENATDQCFCRLMQYKMFDKIFENDHFRYIVMKLCKNMVDKQWIPEYGSHLWPLNKMEYIICYYHYSARNRFESLLIREYESRIIPQLKDEYLRARKLCIHLFH